jgi:hypothetical protein
MEPGPADAKIVSVTNENGVIHIRSAKWEDTVEVGTKVSYHRKAIE